MGEQQLKEFFVAVAADVPVQSGVDVRRAWRAGRRRKAGAATLTAAGVVAVLAIGAVVWEFAGTERGIPAPVATPTPVSPTPPTTVSPTAPVPTASAAGAYHGVPVWWAPPAADEPGLPQRASQLPGTIDISAEQEPFEPGGPALGLFAVLDSETSEPTRFVLLTTAGETRQLPADHMRPNTDRDGNTAALLPFNGGLSPDGWHLFVAQQSSLEVFDLMSGRWITLDTDDWVAEGARWLDGETIWVPDAEASGTGTVYAVDGARLSAGVTHQPPDLQISAEDEPYGIWVDAVDAVAGSYFFAGPMPGGRVGNPEGVVARVGGQTSVLAVSQLDRVKGCCSVLGWLDDHTVAFSSVRRVLAWEVATDTLSRVSEVVGVGPDEYASASWAWHSLS